LVATWVIAVFFQLASGFDGGPKLSAQALKRTGVKTGSLGHRANHGDHLSATALQDESQATHVSLHLGGERSEPRRDIEGPTTNNIVEKLDRQEG